MAESLRGDLDSYKGGQLEARLVQRRPKHLSVLLEEVDVGRVALWRPCTFISMTKIMRRDGRRHLPACRPYAGAGTRRTRPASRPNSCTPAWSRTPTSGCSTCRACLAAVLPPPAALNASGRPARSPATSSQKVSSPRREPANGQGSPSSLSWKATPTGPTQAATHARAYARPRQP
jgi:hypothetical protein